MTVSGFSINKLKLSRGDVKRVMLKLVVTGCSCSTAFRSNFRSFPSDFLCSAYEHVQHYTESQSVKKKF